MKKAVVGGAGWFVPRLLPGERLYSLDSHRIRKEEERHEGKRRTTAYGRDPRGGDVGGRPRHRGSNRCHGGRGGVRCVGVGTPPQRPLLVREAPLYTAVLLLRLQAG